MLNFFEFPVVEPQRAHLKTRFRMGAEQNTGVRKRCGNHALDPVNDCRTGNAFTNPFESDPVEIFLVVHLAGACILKSERLHRVDDELVVVFLIRLVNHHHAWLQHHVLAVHPRKFDALYLVDYILNLVLEILQGLAIFFELLGVILQDRRCVSGFGTLRSFVFVG